MRISFGEKGENSSDDLQLAPPVPKLREAIDREAELLESLGLLKALKGELPIEDVVALFEALDGDSRSQIYHQMPELQFLSAVKDVRYLFPYELVLPVIISLSQDEISSLLVRMNPLQVRATLLALGPKRREQILASIPQDMLLWIREAEVDFSEGPLVEPLLCARFMGLTFIEVLVLSTQFTPQSIHLVVFLYPYLTRAKNSLMFLAQDLERLEESLALFQPPQLRQIIPFLSPDQLLAWGERVAGPEMVDIVGMAVDAQLKGIQRLCEKRLEHYFQELPLGHPRYCLNPFEVAVGLGNGARREALINYWDHLDDTAQRIVLSDLHKWELDSLIMDLSDGDVRRVLDRLSPGTVGTMLSEVDSCSTEEVVQLLGSLSPCQIVLAAYYRWRTPESIRVIVPHLSQEQVALVAGILTPHQVQGAIESLSLENRKFLTGIKDPWEFIGNLHHIRNDEGVEGLTQHVKAWSRDQVVVAIPFLISSKDPLERRVWHLLEKEQVQTAVPYWGMETVTYLVRRGNREEREQVIFSLSPEQLAEALSRPYLGQRLFFFLPKDVVDRVLPSMSTRQLGGLLEFLTPEGIEDLVQRIPSERKSSLLQKKGIAGVLNQPKGHSPMELALAALRVSPLPVDVRKMTEGQCRVLIPVLSRPQVRGMLGSLSLEVLENLLPHFTRNQMLDVVSSLNPEQQKILEKAIPERFLKGSEEEKTNQIHYHMGPLLNAYLLQGERFQSQMLEHFDSIPVPQFSRVVPVLNGGPLKKLLLETEPLHLSALVQTLTDGQRNEVFEDLLEDIYDAGFIEQRLAVLYEHLRTFGEDDAELIQHSYKQMLLTSVSEHPDRGGKSKLKYFDWDVDFAKAQIWRLNARPSVLPVFEHYKKMVREVQSHVCKLMGEVKNLERFYEIDEDLCPDLPQLRRQVKSLAMALASETSEGINHLLSKARHRLNIFGEAFLTGKSGFHHEEPAGCLLNILGITHQRLKVSGFYDYQELKEFGLDTMGDVLRASIHSPRDFDTFIGFCKYLQRIGIHMPQLRRLGFRSYLDIVEVGLREVDDLFASNIEEEKDLVDYVGLVRALQDMGAGKAFFKENHLGHFGSLRSMGIEADRDLWQEGIRSKDALLEYIKKNQK